jgi:hypothetical protein
LRIDGPEDVITRFEPTADMKEVKEAVVAAL